MDNQEKHAIEHFPVKIERIELLEKISSAAESVVTELGCSEEAIQKRHKTIISDIYYSSIVKIAKNLEKAIEDDSVLKMSMFNIEASTFNGLNERAGIVVVSFDHYLDNARFDLVKSKIAELLDEIVLDYVSQKFCDMSLKISYKKLYFLYSNY